MSRELNSNSDFLKFSPEKFSDVIGRSLIRITPVKFDQLPTTDWIFFSSQNAVTCFFDQSPQFPTTVRFGVIGKSTGIALQKYAPVSFTGTGDPKQAAIQFANTIGNQKVLFPISDKSVRTIQKELNNEQVVELIVYKTEPDEGISVPKTDILIFTSPSNVQSYLKSNAIFEDQMVIAIGKTTSLELEKSGIKAELPWQSSELALADICF